MGNRACGKAVSLVGMNTGMSVQRICQLACRELSVGSRQRPRIPAAPQDPFGSAGSGLRRGGRTQRVCQRHAWSMTTIRLSTTSRRGSFLPFSHREILPWSTHTPSALQASAWFRPRCLRHARSSFGNRRSSGCRTAFSFTHAGSGSSSFSRSAFGRLGSIRAVSHTQIVRSVVK